MMLNNKISMGLVDIATVKTNKSLPQHERIAEYVRQIKNPYHFICEELTVTVKYNPDGPPFEDCLQQLMA